MKYHVSTSDRVRRKTIEADSPGEAMMKFVGKRCGNCQLSSWTFNGKESFYNLSVTIDDSVFRMARSAVRNISGHVWID